MSKDATQTSTVRPDQATQQYQDIFRRIALGGLGGLTGNAQLQQYGKGFGEGFAPFNADAMKANIRENFDTQRAGASMTAADLATKAHAFGGSGGEILQAQMLNDVNRNEANALQGVDQQQFQQLMQMLGLAQGNFGTPGSTTSMQMPSNPWGTAIGLGTMAGGLGWKPF